MPVTVYQFNALEYRGQGGPAGKDWVDCPGNQVCAMTLDAVGLLLVHQRRLAAPAEHGDDRQLPGHRQARLDRGQHPRRPGDVMGGYFAITGDAGRHHGHG